MSVIVRRAFSSRAMRVHGWLFVVGVVGFTVLDWLQGKDTTTTTLGLDWAHILMVIWLPLFLFHVLITWWGGEADDLDDKTMRQVRGRWFGGFRDSG